MQTKDNTPTQQQVKFSLSGSDAIDFTMPIFQPVHDPDWLKLNHFWAYTLTHDIKGHFLQSSV